MELLGSLFWLITLIGICLIGWLVFMYAFMMGLGTLIGVGMLLVHYWRWTVPLLLLAGVLWYIQPVGPTTPAPVPSATWVPS